MLSDKNTHCHQEPAPFLATALPAGLITVAGCTAAGEQAPRSPAAFLHLDCCRSWQFETNPEDRA